MKPGWTEVALGEVLSVDIDAVPVDPTSAYPFAGVYGFGRGLFFREPVSGSDTTYSHFHRLHADQVVMSQPKGWEGAVTVVPKEFEGRFLSSVFPTFRCDRTRINPQFMLLVTKCPWLWNALLEKSNGIGARRNAVYAQHLLEVKIPLPPLTEQQRIAARLDAIETRLTRVTQLREEIADTHITFLVNLATRPDLSEAQKIAAGWREIALREVMSAANDPVAVSATVSYPNLGLLNFARGTFTKAPINGATSSATTLFRVRAGQFIYSRLFAFEGAYGIVREDQDGVFVSNEFPAFDLDRSRVLAEFLFAYFKSPVVWRALAEQATGLGDRRRRVHPDIVLSHRLFLPPIQYQKKMQRVVARIATCTEPEAATTALLPSLLDQIFNS